MKLEELKDPGKAGSTDFMEKLLNLIEVCINILQEKGYSSEVRLQIQKLVEETRELGREKEE